LSGFTGGPVDDAGAPDAPVDSPAPPPADASADAPVDAADSAPPDFLAIDTPVSDMNEVVDLSARGTLDWLELHQMGQPNRCATCMQLLQAPTSTAVLDPYTQDDRTWNWSNGAPVAMSSMSGGVYAEGVGTSIVLRTEAAPSKRVLSLWLDTFNTGATIQAAIDGTSLATQSVMLAELPNAPRYAVNVHFAAAAGHTLVVTFTETSAIPLDGDSGNIAFSAMTLAADP
jgi:hypothetical protein